MRQYLFGLAAAAAVAVSSAPAMACYSSCAPVVSFASCAPRLAVGCGGLGFGGGWGYGAGWGGYGASNWAVATVPAPVTYYAVQPQYHYVNQGPTYTGPAMYAPSVAYQARAVGGWSGYGGGYYGYDGGPYANPSDHYYHGMPAVTTPTVYSYRRAYRPVRYGYAPRVYGPRYGYAPRYGYRYGHRVAPRRVAAPYYGPRRAWRYYK